MTSTDSLVTVVNLSSKSLEIRTSQVIARDEPRLSEDKPGDMVNVFDIT